MKEALLIIPTTIRQDDLIDANNFAVSLGRRGYHYRTKPGDKLAVFLDGEQYDYETLRAQARGWTSLEKVSFKRLTETAQLPVRGSFDCAGLDLFADIAESVVIRSGEVGFIPTGVAVQCPPGTYAQIKDRSSLGAKGLAVRGGVIDRDYRGEIKVMLQYVGTTTEDKYTINSGDRVAQIVFVNYIDVQAIEVDSLSPTVRDGRGWGSSGR